MALYLCLNSDCTGEVTDLNPLQTKHTNNGEAKTISAYLVNNGLRTGVENDTSGMALIYTNIQLTISGISHTAATTLSPSVSATSLTLDSTTGWGIGTILIAGTERMRIEEIISSTSIRVTRNYTSDGGTSVLGTHSIGENYTAETTTVSLAPASVDNYDNPGSFNGGGVSLDLFIDPTYLNNAISNAESVKTISSSNGTKYPVNTIIKIDEEQMLVTEQNGNNLTVIRGYNNTLRSSHTARAIIYTVGLVDTFVAHKFFIKNDPPSGLPTQKKADIQVVIVADEEPI